MPPQDRHRTSQTAYLRCRGDPVRKRTSWTQSGPRKLRLVAENTPREQVFQKRAATLRILSPESPGNLRVPYNFHGSNKLFHWCRNPILFGYRQLSTELTSGVSPVFSRADERDDPGIRTGGWALFGCRKSAVADKTALSSRTGDPGNGPSCEHVS